MATVADLGTPYSGVAPDGLGNPITNRFPTPPSAVGFLTDVEGEEEPAWVISGGIASYLGGALAQEGPYLEPTIGQIWPR
jgi:hypothetical protein